MNKYKKYTNYSNDQTNILWLKQYRNKKCNNFTKEQRENGIDSTVDLLV